MLQHRLNALRLELAVLVDLPDLPGGEGGLPLGVNGLAEGIVHQFPAGNGRVGVEGRGTARVREPAVEDIADRPCQRRHGGDNRPCHLERRGVGQNAAHVEVKEVFARLDFGVGVVLRHRNAVAAAVHNALYGNIAVTVQIAIGGLGIFIDFQIDGGGTALSPADSAAHVLAAYGNHGASVDPDDAAAGITARANARAGVIPGENQVEHQIGNHSVKRRVGVVVEDGRIIASEAVLLDPTVAVAAAG